MPFEDDDENKKFAANKGSKLDNSKSMFANKPKKPTQKEFEQSINESQKRNLDYKERATELVSSFRKTLDDKVLPQNKSVFSLDAEKELLQKLVNLGVDMNTDPHEDEGMGSMGLIGLLFRSLLIQRDKINNLDYTVNKLEKQVAIMLSSSVDSGTSND